MEFVNFVCENYRFIIEVILSLTCIAVALLKNKVKVVDSVKEFILDSLPLLIASAEKLFDSGLKKKQFVMESMLSQISDSFPNAKVLDYQAFISKSIEKILSTPEKKEVKK